MSFDPNNSYSQKRRPTPSNLGSSNQSSSLLRAGSNSNSNISRVSSVLSHTSLNNMNNNNNPSNNFTRGSTPMSLSDSVSNFNSIELARLQHYNLDFPEDKLESKALQLDKNSKFYSTKIKRSFEPKDLLPYETESIRDQSKYLAHIVTHLYIAIKSLDIASVISINVKELEDAKKELTKNQNFAFTSDDNFGQSISDENKISNNNDDDDENENNNDYFEILDDAMNDGGNSSDEDDDDEDDMESDDDSPVAATPVRKIGPKSASIISLKNWTKELKNLLSMSILIPVSLSKALIKVYYAIILSRGQSIKIDFYIEVIDSLMKESDILLESGLKLDYKPLLEEFTSVLPTPDSITKNNSISRVRHLYRLATLCHNFFDDEAAPQLIEKIMSFFSPQTVGSSFALFSTMIPINFCKPIIDPISGNITYHANDIRKYLPIFFNLWMTNRNAKDINYLLSLIRKISEGALDELCKNQETIKMGKYGIFNEEQYRFITNQLVLTSKIPKRDERQEVYVKELIEMIINSLNSKHAFEKEGSFDMLKTFFSSIRTLVHPSNSGQWSTLLSKAVKRTAVLYHSRLLEEKEDRQLCHNYLNDYSNLPQDYKLSIEMTNDFIDMLDPIIKLGIQSKSSSQSNRYIAALEVLCFMDSNRVLNSMLLDIYASFDTINSTHRINVVLRELQVLSRFMVMIPVFRTHVPRLLSMLLPGIDSNDPDKTILTVQFVKTVASVIPFYDLTNGNGDGGLLAMDFTTQHLTYLEAKFYKNSPNTSLNIFGDSLPETFEYDEELELNALKSATSSFKEFISGFVDRCFKYLENSPNVEGDDNIEAKASVYISHAFDSLVESMSDELYDVLTEQFFNYISENAKHEVAVIFSNIAEIIIRRNPNKYFPKFFDLLLPLIQEEVKNGAGCLRSAEVSIRDARLIWYYKLLAGSTLGAGTILSPYINPMKEMMLAHIQILKGEASVCVGLLSNCILSATTITRLLERRLISEDYLSKTNGVIDERCWGAFQFDEYRFNTDNLTFKWFQPSSEIVESAVNFYSDITVFTIGKINELLSSNKSLSTLSLNNSDQLGFYINFLENSLTGISSLYDPNYAKILKDSDKLKSRTTFNLRQQKTSNINSVSMTPSTSLSGTPQSEAFMASIDNPLLQNFLGQDQSSELSKAIASKVDESNSNAHGNNKESGADDDFDNAMNLDEYEEKLTDAPLNNDINNISYDIPTDLNSGAASPSVVDMMINNQPLNPSLTDRPNNFYSFGYIYNRSSIYNALDPIYIKLHRTREDIGKCLHQCIEQTSKLDGSVELSTNLILAVSSFLKHVGCVSSINPIFIDNIHLVSMLDIPQVDKPSTRVIIGARLATYHCHRLDMARANRLPTPLDKILIKDLVSLIASPYTQISYYSNTVLSSALGKILNCTHLVFNVFKDWELAITNDDHETIKNILIMFSGRRFKGLPERSGTFIPKYEELLSKSIKLDEIEINSLSLKLYSSIRKNIKVPSKVVLMDMESIESIRPPDAYVDNEIAAVKLAKDIKKSHMLGQVKKLELLGLQRSNEKLHWRFMLHVLELLHSLQSGFQRELNGDILQVLARSVNSIHPTISKKCVIWLALLLETSMNRGDLNYNLKSYYALVYPAHNISKLSDFVSSPKEFFEEMHNFKNPNFFIKNKFWVPTLCWDKEMKVVNSYVSETIGLNEQDTISVESLSPFVTKQWLLEFIKLHIDESEADTAFLPGLVYFLISISTYSLYGHFKNFNPDEFFEIIDEIYEKDERQSHIAVSEIFCAILISFSINQDKIKEADHKIASRLRQIIESDINQSSRSVWNIFCWWLPSHMDPRQIPEIVDVICNFDIQNDDSSSPFEISTRIGFLKCYLSVRINTYHKFDETTVQFFDALAHPYNSVSENIASTLYDILDYSDKVLYTNFDELVLAGQNDESNSGFIYPTIPETFLKCFDQYLQNIMIWKEEAKGLSTQEIVNSKFMYGARGLQFLLMNILKSAHNKTLLPYLKKYIIPLLFELDLMRDACQLMGLQPIVILFFIASVKYSPDQMPEVIDMMLNNHGIASPSLQQSKHLLSFVQAFYVVRYLTITKEQRLSLIDHAAKFLYNPHLQVREQAAKLFATMIHTLIHSEADEVIEKYIKEFNSVLSMKKKKKKLNNASAQSKKLSAEQICLLHGATLGLGALIDAFPYITPPPKWLPGILALLATRCNSIDGIVGRTAKDILSKFKKDRQDTWMIDSKFFTEEQLEDLEGVLWKSYFI